MNDYRRSENPTTPTTSDMTVEQILNDFRQSSIIIHAVGSVKGVEEDVRAFQSSLDQALAAIEAHYAAIRERDIEVARTLGHRAEAYITWEKYAKHKALNLSFAYYLHRRYNELTDIAVAETGNTSLEHYDYDPTTGWIPERLNNTEEQV